MGQGKNLGQGRILGQCRILSQGQILGQGHGLGQGKCACGCIWLCQMVNVCVWLHLAKPDVSVDSADGASSVLIR